MTQVCRLDQLSEGKLTPARIGRAPVLVTLIDGQPLAVAARCPHQGADMKAGCITGLVGAGATGTLTVDPGRPVLRCPWHGFEYDLATGEPTVEAPRHRRMRLRTYPVEIDGDHVVSPV